MACPRCTAKQPLPSAACPACGFSLAEINEQLGRDLVKLGRLTDAANSLRLPEAQAIDAALDELERSFPQVFVGVYLGVLPHTLSMRELTFWLLNHAAFDTRGFQRQNEYAVVLVIDPVAKEAALNTGYALEAALPDTWLETTLRSMRAPLWHGEYETAVLGALNALTSRLRRYARKSSKKDELAPPTTTEEFLQSSGIQPLRTTEPAVPLADVGVLDDTVPNASTPDASDPH